jgi:hypothetical protein
MEASGCLQPAADQEVKKKRGRRPKSEKVVLGAEPISQEVTTNEKAVDANPTDNAVVEEQSASSKGRRGRKPKYVYNAYEMAAQSNNTTLSDDENVIVKLNIQQNNDKDDERIIEEQPYAYNCGDYNNISMVSNCHETENNSADESICEKATHDVRVLELLKDFEEKNKINEWPSNTSIACYWCCHKFNNPPFGVPINLKNDKFEVYGCFCSLECATAYNFKKTDSIDEMWERYNLINLMSRRMKLGTYVKPAPDVLALKMFGGHLDIEKFREYFKTNRVISVNFPPMTSITQQLEEVNEYELNTEYKYIPIDNDRINKYKEKVLFKRNKPLVNNVNSLENSMKLTYH